MIQPRHFVVACGGTGGHLFPGLATARQLRARGHAVTLCLAGRDVESAAGSAWDGNIHALGVRPIPLRKPAAAAHGLITLVRALQKLARCWRQERPAAVLAMGSYASLAPVLTARFLRIPVVLHEANAVPGRAIQRLARLAHDTAVACEDAISALPQSSHTIVTGMPVRRDLAGQPPFEDFAARGFGLLIMGGSQGAQRLNRIAADAVEQLVSDGMHDLAVLHLTGPRDAADIAERYRNAGVHPARVFPFLHEMGRAYASADLVIGRAGAATCAELCLCGVPALLVPLPEAPRDHQTANARRLERRGAALCHPQADLTPENLAATIRRLRAAPEQRDAMRQAALHLAIPDADARLADVVENAATT